MTLTTPFVTTNSGGCGWQSLVGDGYCDDELNNQECNYNYDGGDCCGSNVNTQYCSECVCLGDEGSGGGSGSSTTVSPFVTTDSGGCAFPDWVGDGCCDDGNNNLECNYDGGDCCGSNVNTLCCTECQCLE